MGDNSTRQFNIVLSNPTGGAVLGRSTATVTIKPYAGASLNSVHKLVQVKHYPNPVTQSARIEVEGLSDEQSTVSVYNQVSQIVASVKGHYENGTLVFDLNCERLGAGVYYYEVLSEGVSISKKPMLVLPQ